MFIFSIKTPFTDRPLLIALKTSNQRLECPILYSGDIFAVDSLQTHLKYGFGAFGHPTSDKFSTAEDIHAFLTSKSKDGWTFEERGDNRVRTYTPAPHEAMY